MSKSMLLALTATFGAVTLIFSPANPPVELQAASPGAAQTGHLNISGTATVGLLKSQGTVFGASTATTGFAYGGFFTAASNQGRGFYGYASSSTGLTYGGFFQNASESGRAVYGLATSGTGFNYGGYFQSASTDGRGILGVAAAPSGTTYGVYGTAVSPNGYGVYSNGNMAASGIISGKGNGLTDLNASNLSSGTISMSRIPSQFYMVGDVVGAQIGSQNGNPSGFAVVGFASSSTGNTYGGHFLTSSNAGTGVYASALSTTGNTYGGYFNCTSPDGIGLLGANSSGGTALKAVGKSELIGNVVVNPGFNLGIGDTNPVVPLDFGNTDGDKISLTGTSPATHVGFGVKTGNIRVFTADAGHSIGFGYGSGESFAEGVRFLTGTMTFRPAGTNTPSYIRAPYDITFEKDFDNDSSNAWFRFFTDNYTIEQFRIIDGDEANALFDGAVIPNGIDFAEAFKAYDEDLEPGDLVVNHGSAWDYVSKSSHAYDQGVIGVVSTKPAFVAGMSFSAEDRINPDLTARRDEARRVGDHELEKQLTMRMRELVEQAYRPIAFMGRVPVKVTGAVRVGDHLTASSIPGVAMAMVRSGQSIGIALEPSAGGNAKIMVMVQPGYFAPVPIGYGGGESVEMGNLRTLLERALSDNKTLHREVAELQGRLDRLEKSLSRLSSRR